MSSGVGIIIAILVTVWLSIGVVAFSDWTKERRGSTSPPVGETIRMAFEPCQKALADSWKAPRFATLWTAAWTGVVALVVLLIFWPMVLAWLLPSRSSGGPGDSAGT